jgi:hypothetical protein
MFQVENLRDAKHAPLSRSRHEEAVDDAIERGSPAACWSALFVAIALVSALWFGDFASERVGPAWEAVESEATLLAREANFGHRLQIVTNRLSLDVASDHTVSSPIEPARPNAWPSPQVRHGS